MHMHRRAETRCNTALRILRVAFAMSFALVLSSCSDDAGSPPSTEQLVAEMTQRVEDITVAEKVGDSIPRFNQPKTVACANGEFRVHDDLPAELAHGLFAKPATYPALLRFANATERDDSKKDIRGLSIRLRDVPNPVIWGEPGLQDFLLNSYPALFVATPEDFLSFIRARQEDKKLRFFLSPFDPHLKSLWIAYKARKKHKSPLDIRYWSTVPFRLGESTGQVVKYSVTPCSEYTTKEIVNAGENQLRAAIKSHLQQAPACFAFGVQIQIDEDSMPIDDASVVWDEDKSPFQTVATLTIEDQSIDDATSLDSCERSQFNPWQSLAAHEPLGRMNEVRREVYAEGAKLRNRSAP